MSHTTSRAVLAGALALAAMAVIDGVAPGGTAAAAPGGSPFAGIYDAAVPAAFSAFGGPANPGFTNVEVEIDRQGHFLYWEFDGLEGTYAERFDGKVSNKGVMTCSGGGNRLWVSWSIDFKANVTKDASGDLVGTTTDGTTFVWTRR